MEKDQKEPKWIDGNGKVYESSFDVPPVGLAAIVRGELRARMIDPSFRYEAFEALDTLMTMACDLLREREQKKTQ